MLDGFNVFEAIGFIGREVMHSRFLAFLLDPRQNHGLGDLFLGESKRYLWFHPVAWEASALVGLLGFVFHKRPDRLDLFLETSPGDEKVRRKLFEMGQKYLSLLNSLQDPDTGKYPKLYRRTFLDPDSQKDISESDSTEEIRMQWGEFLDKDLPRIEEVLKSETWIWEPVETDLV